MRWRIGGLPFLPKFPDAAVSKYKPRRYEFRKRRIIKVLIRKQGEDYARILVELDDVEVAFRDCLGR